MLVHMFVIENIKRHHFVFDLQLVHAVAMQIFVICTQENVSAQLKE